MKKYDAIVIGSGSGLDVANAAAGQGLDVAVVEEGPLGGTCLNRGCVPSKMLIHRADVVQTIKNSGEFHIDSEIRNVDFPSIVREVNEDVGGDAESIERGLRSSDSIDLYKKEARFTGERRLEAGGEEIKGEKVVVAAGSRPAIPPVDGLDGVDYLTSKEALELEDRPDSMVIVGGGYISAELGHFFGSMGTDVKTIESGENLIKREDIDISEKFTEIYRKRFDVHTGYRATEVREDDGRVSVTAEREDGGEIQVDGDRLLMATGRRPNTDLLDVEKAGIETDERGFIKVDKKMKTTAENVWALGDIVNTPMFKHTANLEARYVFINAFTDHEHEVDYRVMPHAIFSSPQVSAVGKTEQELRDGNRDYIVGRYDYKDTAMGSALKEEDGFVKVLADPDTGKILGCHVLGPRASMLIHEVVVAMESGDGTVLNIKDSVHVHPALNEVVQRAFSSL